MRELDAADLSLVGSQLAMVLEAVLQGVERGHVPTIKETADLAAAIEAAGGLVDARDLARRFGVTKQAVSLWQRDPTFPAPVTRVGGSKVWAFGHVESWRRERPTRRLRYVRALQPGP